MTKYAYYYVEEILARRENGKEEFLVKWRGHQEPNWEPLENLKGCRTRLEEFYAKFEPTRNVFEVEKILQKWWNKKIGKMMYLVQWRYYPKSAQTYEPREHLECEEMLEEFEEKWRMRAAKKEQRRLQQKEARRPKVTRYGRKTVARKL